MTHKPPEFITRFSRQLSHILADYLTNPNVGNKRHPLQDHQALSLLFPVVAYQAWWHWAIPVNLLPLFKKENPDYNIGLGWKLPAVTTLSFSSPYYVAQIPWPLFI
jgi:hypothetical protein